MSTTNTFVKCYFYTNTERYINEIDDRFFIRQGNYVGMGTDRKKLVASLDREEENNQFHRETT